MASLLESLAGSITPEMAGTLGQALGLDKNMIEQGMGVVGPLLESTMADSAGTQEGLDGMMQMLGKVQEAQASGNFDVGGLINQFAEGAGGKDMLTSLLNTAMGGKSTADDPISGFLGSMFGDGLGAVGGTLDKSLGFPVSGLIAAAAPMVVGTLSKMAKEGNLDAAGVAKLLQGDADAFAKSGSDASKLVAQAKQAGKDAVALKGRYTEQEWSTIRLAPMAAAALVMSASPSKGNAAADEIASAMAAIEATKVLSAPVSLLSVAFDAPMSQAELDKFKTGVTQDQMVGALKNAAALIGSKDPVSLTGYQTLVMNVATATAEAAKEGGFLGIGGKQVSDAERAAIETIKATIGA